MYLQEITVSEHATIMLIYSPITDKIGNHIFFKNQPYNTSPLIWNR